MRNQLLTFITILLWACFVHAQAFVPGEVIVKLKGSSKSAQSGSFMGKAKNNMNLKASYGKMNLHHFTLKSKTDDVHQKINELKNDPNVEFAEPNYILSVPNVEVSQEVFTEQNLPSSYTSQAGSYTQSYANTKVTNAWGSMSGSSLAVPVVAVIDTGVDYNHSVFTGTGAIWSNSGEVAGNGIDDDGNGYIDDIRGWNFHANNNNPMDDDRHGTHVAGIALGVTQDIFESPLAAAKVRIMPLKFLGADGSGTTAGAVAAINYAVNNGAHVINNSWGGSAYSQSLHEALTYAYNANVTIVCAAGNYSNNNDTTDMYPANFPIPGLISVAATNDYDSMASFSNYGATRVHVAAPGVGIFSTTPSNSYRYLSGTSMAAPFVAGLAAMMLREAPQLTGFQIRNLISSAVFTQSNLYGKVSSSGRVDALESTIDSKAEVSTAAYQPDYVARDLAGAFAGDSGSSGGGGCGTVATTALLNKMKSGSGNFTGMNLAIGFAMLPLLVWFVVRSQAKGRTRRKHERFVMNSEIKVNVNGRELTGQMKTISEGGLSFQADALLDKGGIVTMMIASPDGEEQVQVQGHIVWSEANKAYGVQFDQARDTVLSRIKNWTSGLVKAA